MTESVVLAAGAGVLGVTMAVALLRSLIAIVPPDTIPDEAQIAINLPVLVFCAGVSMGAALLFGLAPALAGGARGGGGRGCGARWWWARWRWRLCC